MSKPEVNAVVVESKRPPDAHVVWWMRDGDWRVAAFDNPTSANAVLASCDVGIRRIVKPSGLPAEHSHADERDGELHENGCECGGTADPELCLRAGCERRAAK